MSVLIVFQDMGGREEGFSFSQTLPGIYHLAAETGPQVQIPVGMPETTPTMMGMLASMLFSGEHSGPCWDRGWPQGYLAALGGGLDPDPSLTWASLALTHLRQNRDQLVFINEREPWAASVHVTELIEVLRSPLAELKWRVHGPVDGQVLLSSPLDCRVDVAPLENIHGQSMQNVLPRGEGAGRLLELLTTGQLVLARTEANRRRVDQGLMPMNTPWIHGVGRGNDFFCHDLQNKVRGAYWCEDSTSSGLARQAGWTKLEPEAKTDARFAGGCDELESLANRVAQAALRGPVLVQFSITTPLRLEQIGREFVRPLVEFLAAANQGLLVWAREAMGRHSPETVTGIHWGFGRGRKLLAKPRFWRRQTWGMGESLTMDKSRKLWLS